MCVCIPHYFGVLTDDVQLKHISALHTFNQPERHLQQNTTEEHVNETSKQEKLQLQLAITGTIRGNEQRLHQTERACFMLIESPVLYPDSWP